MDEFTEFRRDAAEGRRQPLEDGRVVVTRMVGSVEFPARFTLVAAANPCPCGFAGDTVRRCTFELALEVGLHVSGARAAASSREP